MKIKEVDLENEKKRQEISKLENLSYKFYILKSRLTEELNNSKILLLKKEEEYCSLQENQTKIV